MNKDSSTNRLLEVQRKIDGLVRKHSPREPYITHTVQRIMWLVQELLNEKTPKGASSYSLSLNTPNYTSEIRQNLLDLIGEYRELDFPANPELLKLHIDAATDRLEKIVNRASTLRAIEELKAYKMNFATDLSVEAYEALNDRINQLKGKQ